MHAIGASKGWDGQGSGSGSGSGTWLGERGRQSSQRGRQRQRKTGRAVGVGVLATGLPTCVETSVVSTKYRGVVRAQVAIRCCRAVTWAATRRTQERICVWQILQAEGRVPYVRTYTHACVLQDFVFCGSTGIVGLAFGPGADTWVSGPRVRRVLAPLGTVGDWNCIRRRQRAEECVSREGRDQLSCSFPNTRCLARPGSGTRTSQMPGGCQGLNVGTMQNPRSTCVREAAARIWQV